MFRYRVEVMETDQHSEDPEKQEEGRMRSHSTTAFKTRLERFRHHDRHGTFERVEDKTSSSRTGWKRSAAGISRSVSPSSSPSSGKKRRQSRYAPPSKYAHLPVLLDILEPGLITVFVGTNPGIRTATAGHAYAHPSNLFWKLLHSSGCTDVRLPPANDVNLPQWYAMGNTNIVERPSKDAAELSKSEMAAGTPVLEEKFRKYRPESVCIVGKGIWEAIWRWRYKREIRKDEFKWGWQDEKERMGKDDDWDGAAVYVTSSTSGLSASLKPPEKEAIWKPFGEWVRKRRRDRFGTEGRIDHSPQATDGVTPADTESAGTGTYDTNLSIRGTVDGCMKTGSQ